VDPVQVAIVAQVNPGLAGFQGKVARVAAAVQAQVAYELLAANAWANFGVPQATVMSYPRMADAPDDALFVLLVENAFGNAGMHVAPQKPNESPDGRPSPRSYAVVQYRSDDLWTYALSHEVLEMLVDPAGNRLVPGAAPYRPDTPAQYLVEVCDPCQDTRYAYHLQSFPDILLCDFCYPSFYGLSEGGPYTRSRAVSKSFDIAQGGCLSFMTEGEVWQKWTPEGITEIDPNIGTTTGDANFRGLIDRTKGYAGPQQQLTQSEVRRMALTRRARSSGIHANSSASHVRKHARSLGLLD
jgi:hypothetical protein